MFNYMVLKVVMYWKELMLLLFFLFIFFGCWVDLGIVFFLIFIDFIDLSLFVFLFIKFWIVSFFFIESGFLVFCLFVDAFLFLKYLFLLLVKFVF